MQILYLAHRVPFPPNKGDKIRTYHHLRHLAASHAVHLLAFADRAEDAAWAEALRDCCRSVTVIPLTRAATLVRASLALVHGGSISAGVFADAAMARAVRRTMAEHAIDVAWASSSAVAQHVVDLPAYRIVDFADVDSAKWREFADHAAPPLRWAYALEARRLLACERRVAAAAQRVLLVSDVEADCLRRALPQAPIAVVPNGVDSDHFAAPPAAGERSAAEVVFVGALDYRPNLDAVRFFLESVLPPLRARVPHLTFTAVGHRPPARLRAAVRRAGANLAGSVPDVRPYLHAAAVYVAPLRYGRGVKNKVLEAMAAGVPVVASPVAVDGLAVRDGVEVLVARSPEQWTEAVAALLGDALRLRALAANARAYVQRAHRWPEVLRALDGCLDAVPRRAQVK